LCHRHMKYMLCQGHTKPGLVTVYDIRPGNRKGLFFQPSRHRSASPHSCTKLQSDHHHQNINIQNGKLLETTYSKLMGTLSRCCTYLERSAAARHVCTLVACFSQSSENAPLQTLLSVTPSSVFCRACEVTCHNWTH